MHTASIDNRSVNITAVIVTWNAAKWIEKALHSLQRSSVPPAILVVDNHSTDNTLQLVREQFPAVSILTNSTNLGFGKANNGGISRALQSGAEFVYLMNQDASVAEHTLELLVQSALQHPEFFVLSPAHLDGEGKLLEPAFATYFQRRQNQEKDPEPSHPVRVPFVNAAHWLISRACLETVGGFDPLFFMYGEDNDLLNRVHFHGRYCGVVEQATAFHHRASANRDDRTYLINRRRSEYLIVLKNINRHLVSCVGSVSFTALKRMAKRFFLLRWRSFLLESSVYLSLLFSLRVIIQHRRLCRASAGKRLWLNS